MLLISILLTGKSYSAALLLLLLRIYFKSISSEKHQFLMISTDDGGMKSMESITQ